MNNLFAVVVTWNGEDCIAKCLCSLLDSDTPIQIVVVDNASSDQTMKIAQAICPNAIFFQLTHNLGFGKANNIGIKYAYEQGAEHILLLNQDARVDVNTMSALVDLQRANPMSGILSPLHLDATGLHLDRLFANHIGKSAQVGKLLSDVLLQREIASIYQVDFINAAIWLLSRDCVSRIGLFNPAFDHYLEDNEYTDRVRYHGLNVSLSPVCRGYHERNQDLNPKNVTITRYRLIVYATAQYRILRRTPGVWFNIASALSCILLSSSPINTSFAKVIIIKLGLVCKLLLNLPAMLRCRKRAYQGVQCFFEDAELDRRRFAAL